MINYEELECSDLHDFLLTLSEEYFHELIGISDQLYAEWRGWTE